MRGCPGRDEEGTPRLGRPRARRPASVTRLRSVIRETTGSLGVRVTVAERWPAARTNDSVWVDGQLIRVKVSAARIKAEHDDVAAAARRTGQPLREVAFRAEALWRSEHGRQPEHDQPAEPDEPDRPDEHMLAPLLSPDEAGTEHPAGSAAVRRWGTGGRGRASDRRREDDDDPA